MIRRLVLALVFAAAPLAAFGQEIGTFRWQTQPSCNVITFTVTQVNQTFRLEGTDDHCGGPTQASALGTAFLNPNGTIGLAFSVIGTAGGAPTFIQATVTAAAGYSGTWSDREGRSGTFALIAGAGNGGPVRPRAPLEASFVHTVTTNSQFGPCTELDHPLANGDVNAIVIASHIFNGAYLGADTSVDFAGGRWLICRSNGIAPPAGHQFNVLVRKP